MVSPAAAPLPVRSARFVDLTPAQLHGLIQVRLEVFVLEQNCVYLDLDGRDTEPGTIEFWQETPEGEVVSTLRLLDNGEERSIGRVATREPYRRRGLSGALVQAAIDASAGLPVRISAQAYLEQWYSRFGFVAYGEGYLEDGMPHIGMLRPSDATPTPKDPS